MTSIFQRQKNQDLKVAFEGLSKTDMNEQNSTKWPEQNLTDTAAFKNQASLVVYHKNSTMLDTNKKCDQNSVLEMVECETL